MNPTPTKRQQKIISDPNFPRYLTAGPGTGKTEVLINKIMYLLENEHSGKRSKFAVITYTNKATAEMRSRLNDRIYNENSNISPESINLFEISTIHSFCYTLLRKYASEIGFDSELQIKSYTQELSCIVDALLSRTKEPLFNGIADYRLCHIVKDILKECYTHGIVPAMHFIKHNNADDKLWSEIEAALMRICIDAHNELEQLKQKENSLTLNDLISMTMKLLENENTAKQVASDYTYLFIDEFQDTNRSQLEIVRILIGAGVKVFLIGDEKQSIYAFRGADIECSRQAKMLFSTYHSPDDFEINENFRTDQNLLMKINEVFNRPFMYKGKRLSFPQAPLVKTEELQKTKAANDNPFRITYGEEVTDIIAALTKESLHEKKIQYGDIFMLCRTNYEVRQISGKLRRSGIPCATAPDTEPSGFFDGFEEADNDTPHEEYLREIAPQSGVNILTIHKAKGLSLPIVIIPNIDRNLLRKRNLPDYIIDRTEKTFALGNVTRRIIASQKYLHLLNEKTMRRLEEELRILYVAMTRVEHILVMTTRDSKDELKKAARDKERISWNDWINPLDNTTQTFKTGENRDDSKLQRFYQSIVASRIFNGRRK